MSWDVCRLRSCRVPFFNGCCSQQQAIKLESQHTQQNYTFARQFAVHSGQHISVQLRELYNAENYAAELSFFNNCIFCSSFSDFVGRVGTYNSQLEHNVVA
jgi:hypothetical protein